MLLPPVYIVSLNKSGDLIFSQEKIKIEEERGKKWKIKYQNLEGKISTGISQAVLHICTDVYTHTHKKNNRERQTYNT